MSFLFLIEWSQYGALFVMSLKRVQALGWSIGGVGKDVI